MPAEILLKPGREKSLLRRHPWVFSGAVKEVHDNPAPGDTVALRVAGKQRDASGRFIAWASYSPKSQIVARVWTWDEGETVDESFFRRRLQAAINSRRPILSPAQKPAGSDLPTGSAIPDQLSVRLVHAESDFLPGVILDRYDDTLVLQILTAGAERWREYIAHNALELSGAARIFERSDADVRALEGLPPRTGWLCGTSGETRMVIQENGLQFIVDIESGHKTGFYLDQRANRARVRTLAVGRVVLDCFCYTGGFTVSALAGGAEAVMAVDASAAALALARENAALNGFTAGSVEWQEGDVFHVLRGLRDRGRAFDMIILDPPKFAPTAAQAERAARGYKDINLLAFKLLRPGGLLVTFSCSGGVSEELFQKIVAGAALDAGTDVQIIERLHQSPDHPVALNFPEGAYLQGLVLRRM